MTACLRRVRRPIFGTFIAEEETLQSEETARHTSTVTRLQTRRDIPLARMTGRAAEPTSTASRKRTGGTLRTDVLSTIWLEWIRGRSTLETERCWLMPLSQRCEENDTGVDQTVRGCSPAWNEWPSNATRSLEACSSALAAVRCTRSLFICWQWRILRFVKEGAKRCAVLAQPSHGRIQDAEHRTAGFGRAGYDLAGSGREGRVCSHMTLLDWAGPCRI